MADNLDGPLKEGAGTTQDILQDQRAALSGIWQEANQLLQKADDATPEGKSRATELRQIITSVQWASSLASPGQHASRGAVARVQQIIDGVYPKVFGQPYRGTGAQQTTSSPAPSATTPTPQPTSPAATAATPTPAPQPAPAAQPVAPSPATPRGLFSRIGAAFAGWTPRANEWLRAHDWDKTQAVWGKGLWSRIAGKPQPPSAPDPNVVLAQLAQPPTTASDQQAAETLQRTQEPEEHPYLAAARRQMADPEIRRAAEQDYAASQLAGFEDIPREYRRAAARDPAVHRAMRQFHYRPGHESDEGITWQDAIPGYDPKSDAHRRQREEIEQRYARLRDPQGPIDPDPQRAAVQQRIRQDPLITPQMLPVMERRQEADAPLTAREAQRPMGWWETVKYNAGQQAQALLTGRGGALLRPGDVAPDRGPVDRPIPAFRPPGTPGAVPTTGPATSTLPQPQVAQQIVTAEAGTPAASFPAGQPAPAGVSPGSASGVSPGLGVVTTATPSPGTTPAAGGAPAAPGPVRVAAPPAAPPGPATAAGAGGGGTPVGPAPPGPAAAGGGLGGGTGGMGALAGGGTGGGTGTGSLQDFIIRQGVPAMAYYGAKRTAQGAGEAASPFVGQAEGAVAGDYASTMAGMAVGGGTLAAGAATSNPLMMAQGAGMLGKEAINLPGKLIEWTEALLKSKEAIGQFNQAIASAQATAELRGVQRAFQSGQRTGGAYSNLSDAYQDFQDTAQPVKDSAFNAIARDVAAGVRDLTELTGMIRSYMQKKGWIESDEELAKNLQTPFQETVAGVKAGGFVDETGKKVDLQGPQTGAGMGGLPAGWGREPPGGRQGGQFREPAAGPTNLEMQEQWDKEDAARNARRDEERTKREARKPKENNDALVDFEEETRRIEKAQKQQDDELAERRARQLEHPREANERLGRVGGRGPSRRDPELVDPDDQMPNVHPTMPQIGQRQTRRADLPWVHGQAKPEPETKPGEISVSGAGLAQTIGGGPMYLAYKLMRQALGDIDPHNDTKPPNQTAGTPP